MLVFRGNADTKGLKVRQEAVVVPGFKYEQVGSLTTPLHEPGRGRFGGGGLKQFDEGAFPSRQHQILHAILGQVLGSR